ncbi:uncharacterized protein LOC126323779 [Schistocerca gregaria]|uniref:uncharacterized protein LOC126323779 n=1 Tax=Schistocerca gregaria TaxID=7010 RepID=UPI00211DEDF2|nr:uncharacterized protein LOC126323779 [Schistocerca gregaria]XP_049850735.1 uncharacterized protein LOC126323779 [Schistocerca gregaria]XP_049850736.1 uncharacterized protein LOC126323779 [Schistocerca gregaria]
MQADSGFFHEHQYPNDVGILAMDIYFPKLCVSHTELEIFDQVPTGKYTIGLGQKSMAFVSDLEDINSLCLTVAHNLLEKYGIDPRSIGRLEVGTETILDKSKPTKSLLMDLFFASGNTDIEGADVKSACYGGTSAIFNSLNWIESSAWDGRLALVVTGDIACYSKGNARPTGGAGAVAILLGPDAPVVFDRRLRSSYMENTWDFYKPNLNVEYPVVDGPFSNDCYLKALSCCYELYAKKYKAQYQAEFNLDLADFVCFHSPYNKLVQKSIAWLLYKDYLATPHSEKFADIHLQLMQISAQDKREMEKIFLSKSRSLYQDKVLDSTFLPRHLGNCYAASLYSALISLLLTKQDQLVGKRILLFSFGSGLTASMFSVYVKSSIAKVVNPVDIRERFTLRKVVSPRVYNEMVDAYDETSQVSNFTPKHSVQELFPKTWYLAHIDEKKRRYYERTTSGAKV